jgi:ubiquinone/menaquinone biosynthesis C-methylase UbiE
MRVRASRIPPSEGKPILDDIGVPGNKVRRKQIMRNAKQYGHRDEDQATHQEHAAKMKDYYAKTAHLYNSWHSDTSSESSHNYAVRELIRLVERLEATSVLDVCCGTGRATKSILDLGLDAHGIDISPDLIKLGITELGIPTNCLSVGDATELPFKDGQFDVSCILGALHHTARPRAIIAEMLRVSKLGIVVSDEGNHLSGGLKSILVSMGIFEPIYRMLFKRPPRKSRRAISSDGDGPTFIFSVEEVIPQITEVFPVMKALAFFRVGRFQTCSYWYPRLFARQVVVIASKL